MKCPFGQSCEMNNMGGLIRIIAVSYALIIGFSLAGCGEQAFEPIYDVPEDLQTHVDTFIAEAAIRGHEFTINNLIIEYDPELAFSTCGMCNSDSKSNDIQKVVKINPNCTIRYNEQIECLVFHELGHCFLGRQHNSDLLPNGDPKSIMIPNDFNLYAPCTYQFGEKECDFRYKRDYYLDELLDESTPVPDWAK
ncbi:MAG: hypothetical protein JSW71_05625 [Gemmatimonadota bacterium]|nr:MAG: hypothetical protein JSW71_05625 [Gemmatimonadota bacterium]